MECSVVFRIEITDKGRVRTPTHHSRRRRDQLVSSLRLGRSSHPLSFSLARSETLARRLSRSCCWCYHRRSPRFASWRGAERRREGRGGLEHWVPREAECRRPRPKHRAGHARKTDGRRCAPTLWPCPSVTWLQRDSDPGSRLAPASTYRMTMAPGLTALSTVDEGLG